MIEIDGRKGGGQILRTALSLSAVKGENFKIDNIRGSRKKPGLKPQHLECVKAAARLCDAKLEGAEKGSEKLVFKPGNLRNESFTVNIGTAGSITLLFETILPIATHFDDYFRLRAKGGTDVRWSPPFRSFEAKMELLNGFGCDFNSDLIKTGYYPKGGGEARLEYRGSSLEPLKLGHRGEMEMMEIYSKATENLESSDVASRQADELERKLKNQDPSIQVRKETQYIEAASTGSTLVLVAEHDNSMAVFDNLGEQGKTSEQVAHEVFRNYRKFSETDAAVDRNIADQLLVLLALVGGEIRVPEITNYVQTNLETIRKFGLNPVLEGRTVYLEK